MLGAGLDLDAGKLAVIALVVVAAASYAAADGLIADLILAHFGFSFLFIWVICFLRTAFARYEFAQSGNSLYAARQKRIKYCF